MNNKFFASYVSPEMEMLEMSVECGFAGSPQMEDPKENPDQPW
jgi:hypothetical protein